MTKEVTGRRGRVSVLLRESLVRTWTAQRKPSRSSITRARLCRTGWKGRSWRPEAGRAMRGHRMPPQTDQEPASDTQKKPKCKHAHKAAGGRRDLPEEAEGTRRAG